MFWKFQPQSDFEREAYHSALDFLESKDDELSEYYLVSHGFDAASRLYTFEIVHFSTFHVHPQLLDQTYKNGIIFYDFKLGKVVKFIRDKRYGKLLKPGASDGT